MWNLIVNFNKKKSYIDSLISIFNTSVNKISKNNKNIYSNIIILIYLYESTLCNNVFFYININFFYFIYEYRLNIVVAKLFFILLFNKKYNFTLITYVYQ